MKKIAIVADWLTSFGGAERVILALHEMFPYAPIYTSIYNSKKCKGFEKADIRTSFIQHLPGSKNHHQMYLPLMPYAFESFDFSEYDIVLSSCHSCSKGVITNPGTLHICYCHSPMRYVWDGCHEYVKQYNVPWPISSLVPFYSTKLRIWDRAAADRVDQYIANSAFISKRIKKYYQRESDVIHPFVDLDKFEVKKEMVKDGYFLALGRLIPYKKFDLVVQVFNELKLPLKIIGTGKDEKKLKKMANSNIEFFGFVSEKELGKFYREARALIFPQIEDFGITPLEAMACGTPVIAFQGGGALETIDEKSGVFFGQQNAASLKEAIIKFENSSFDPKAVRKQAEKFSKKIFEEKIKHLIDNVSS